MDSDVARKPPLAILSNVSNKAKTSAYSIIIKKMCLFVNGRLKQIKMKKRKFNYLVAILLIAMSFAACDKDDLSGNANLSISAKIENGVIQKSASEVTSATLTFNEGYVWVREIVFDGDIKGGQTVSKTIERFSKIDFATGTATPTLDDVIIPAGEYTFINLGVELRDEDNQPSILMKGIYQRTDGTSSPIEFRFNSGEVFEAESEGAVVESDETAFARIVFDPTVWFSVISVTRLDNATVNDDGVIIISGNNNSSIFDDVADRLDISTQAEFE